MAQIIISELPPLPDGTGSGTPKGTDLTPATDTTDTTEAPTGTTKKYTRAAEFNYYMNAQGFVTKAACRVATTVALTVTYANGALGVGATLTNAGAQAALSLDGFTLAVGDRVLVKNQVSQFQNGIYTVTNIGSGATNWVMTRATDYDQAADVNEGDLVLVNQGTVSAGKAYEQTSPGPFTIGTTSIIFTLFNSSTVDFTWNVITDASQQMTNNNGYIADRPTLVTLILPISSVVGDEIAVAGKGLGLWRISQGAGQTIHVGSTPTSLGVGGRIDAQNAFDSIYLVCIAASTEWTCLGAPQGILTVI